MTTLNDSGVVGPATTVQSLLSATQPLVATTQLGAALTQPLVTPTAVPGLATTTPAANPLGAGAPTTSPYRPVHAVVYDRPVPQGIPASPLVALLVLIAVPPLLLGLSPKLAAR